MSRTLLVSIMLLLLMLTVSCAKRNTAYQDGGKLSLAYTIPVVGDPYHLNHVGGKLYVAMDQGGLGIIDPQTHHLKSFTSLSAADGSVVNLLRIRKVGVVPERNLMFLNEIQGTDLIRIIDTANPDSLDPFDSITGASQDIQDMICRNLVDDPDDNLVEIIYCNGIFINYGRFNGNLWIGSDFSIEAPASITGLDMDEQYIYAAAQQRGLFVYERSDHPQLISETSFPGEAQKIVVHDGIAYFASRQSGIQILDVSNPQNPSHLSSFDTTGYASDLAYHDGKLAVSSGSGGVYFFDVTDPANPKLVQRITECGYANTVAFVDNQLVIASRDEGILFYDID